MSNTIHELTHFGILGMRWGTRRGAQGNSSSPAKKKKKPEGHADYEEAKRLRQKKMSEMSDAELKKLLNRNDLEKRYNDYYNKKGSGTNGKIQTGIKIATTLAGLYKALPKEQKQKIKDKGSAIVKDLLKSSALIDEMLTFG